LINKIAGFAWGFGGILPLRRRSLKGNGPAARIAGGTAAT
jgi:hypothetical protein